MSLRRPQPRCRCGHAKTRHFHIFGGYIACHFCNPIECPGYQQDNLKTLERLYVFNEARNAEKEKERQV